MPTMGPTELILILVMVLMFFGASKLSQIGGALGRSVREFRREVADDHPRRLSS